MTNENDQDLTRSSQQKLTKYSSDLIKKGLGLAKSIQVNSDNQFIDFFLEGKRKNGEGNYQEAIQLLNKALSINPKYWDAYHARGFSYENLEDYQSAINDYNRALEINPNSAKTYSNRGNLYKELNNYQSAMEDYNQALRIDPNYLNAYHNRGNLYQSLKNYPQAIDNYSGNRMSEVYWSLLQ